MCVCVRAYIYISIYTHTHKKYFQGHYAPSLRHMSTVASVGMESKQGGLKLLVNGGPRAQKLVGIWLFGSAAWVFSMVILGGVTRLTESGLSMTDWNFSGRLPPLSHEDWLVEFDKYKQTPEFKRLVVSICISTGNYDSSFFRVPKAFFPFLPSSGVLFTN